MSNGNIKTLNDGTEVLLRLLKPEDADQLYEFFSKLSPEARQFLYDDVSDRAVVESWTRNINYNNIVPIVAVHSGRIVADGTLHKRNNGPSRHMGRTRVVVSDDFLGRGLGRLITAELEIIARARKLRYLYSVLAERNEGRAIEMLKALGFERTATLPHFLSDPEGNLQDAVVMMKAL